MAQEKAFNTAPTITREEPKVRLDDREVFIVDARISSIWKRSERRSNGEFVKTLKTLERKSDMNRVVTLKGPSIDSQDEYVLTECLKIMFPDCEIEIRSTRPENSRDEEGHNRFGRNQFAQ
jgi:hypothetical protein